jgi:hypothetical protein
MKQLIHEFYADEGIFNIKVGGLPCIPHLRYR